MLKAKIELMAQNIENSDECIELYHLISGCILYSVKSDFYVRQINKSFLYRRKDFESIKTIATIICLVHENKRMFTDWRDLKHQPEADMLVYLCERLYKLSYDI